MKRIAGSRGNGLTKGMEVQARREGYENTVAGLNAEIVAAQRTVANERVDELEDKPQDLVNAAGMVITLLWVKARWGGMPETDETVAALAEARLLVADLLLRAWARGIDREV